MSDSESYDEDRGRWEELPFNFVHEDDPPTYQPFLMGWFDLDDCEYEEPIKILLDTSITRSKIHPFFLDYIHQDLVCYGSAGTEVRISLFLQTTDVDVIHWTSLEVDVVDDLPHAIHLGSEWIFGDPFSYLSLELLTRYIEEEDDFTSLPLLL